MKKRGKKKEKKVDYKRIWQMLWPNVKKPALFYGPAFLFLGTLAALLTLAEPYIYGQIIDSVIESVSSNSGAVDGFKLIVPFLIAWSGVVVLQTIGSFGFSLMKWHFGNKLLGSFTENLFSRMMNMDVEKFRSEKSGEILRKFDNAWDAVWTINGIFIYIVFRSLTVLFFAIGIGFYLDWRMMLVSLFPVPFIIGIGLFSLFNTEASQRNTHKYWEKITGHASDVFTNITTVKSHVNETLVTRTYRALYAKALKYQMKNNVGWAFAMAGYGGLYVAGRLMIFVVGTYLVFQGLTTLGTMIMFLGFMGFVFGSVQQVMDELPKWQQSMTRLDRAASFWYNLPKVVDSEEAIVKKRLSGGIEFKNVSFAYKNGAKVLNNLSFKIPEGETWALVGESGAGKSTLAQMMLRFHDPGKGSIKIDDIDIKDLALKSLRKSVDFVMQENLLFHTSILDNIKLAKTNATKEQIIAASKAAQAHNFIKKLKRGYNTVVGERGVKLSGGEKQRIALARVLLEDPPILVLDEATSALDSKTEHDLQEALAEVMKDRTTIVIAHRLSTVMQADKILVMDKGRIVDSGTHEQLIKRDTLYKKFWQIQAGGYV